MSTPNLPGTLQVIPLADPLYDSLGHDPRSVYAEQFWLPVVGPATLWLARRLAWDLAARPDGFSVAVGDLGASIGCRSETSTKPIARAVQRLCAFDFAHLVDDRLAARLKLPPLAARHIRHLPDVVAEAHRRLPARKPAVVSA